MTDTLLTPELEQKLLERARRGDGEAFGRIYDAYKRNLYVTVIYPRVNDADAAEEVLQETFLLALNKLDTFEWQGRSIFFWLRMIAINKAREWINSQRRHATVDEEVLNYQHDVSFQPERDTIEKEQTEALAARIAEVLGQINERYREAIELRLKKKLPRDECARILDVTVETFDVIFFRACKSFRQKYIKKYGDFAGSPI
jgi:RNA polymerase sigma-70 factor (ECF subfamily)